MNWLTLGSSVPWSALVATRPDGTLAVGPRARRIADTTPDRAISPMAVLTSVRGGSLPDDFPVSGWGPEGGIVTLGEHRFEFYEVLLAFAKGVRETFVAELPRDDFKAFIAMPAALEPAAAGMLRSAVREAGFEHPDFQPIGESLVRAYGLDDRSVDDVLIIHVEDTHTLVAVAQRSGRNLTVTSSEVLKEVSTRAIDDAALELVLENLTEQHGEEHRDDPVAVGRIREALDFARNDLRRSPTIELRVTLSSASGATGVGVERTVQVSRSLLFSKTERLASTLHERILARLNERQIEPSSIGAIVVSGPGGSYPPFSQVVERLCEQPPLGSIPPPHALAVGLARWGRSQTQSDVAKRPDTLDASIGIELPGGRFRPLLPAGAQLPLRFKRQQPVRPHEGRVELRIHQGDSEYVKGCDYLGALVIGPIREEDRGTIKIELDMEVDVEGVLQARIAEPFSGLRGQVVTATRQTPDERRKTLPPSPTRAPPAAPPASAEPPGDGGFLKRLFGRKN
jgi:molecular chaperone DnaK